MHTVSQLLVEFFAFLDEREIEYCVMGDSQSLPQHIASDVDIIVSQYTATVLPALVGAFCERNGFRLVQCLQHEHNAFYFVLALGSAGGKVEFIALDLCGDYCRHGRQFLRADELLAGATEARDAAGDSKGFKVAAPAFEFGYYLVKKIDKESLNARHAEHLTGQWRLDPRGGKQMVERFWGDSAEARLLIRAADCGDWSTVTKLLPRMCASLRRRVRPTLAASLREFARRWRRWRQPTGALVAVLGPDGSGKSSVIAAADRQIRELFRSTAIVHLRPGFLYRPERMPSVMPHSTPPRGRTRSFLKLLFFAADYCLGYVFYIRPLLVRSHGVLFDRYYDDLLVDPRRYRHRGSLSMAFLLRRIVPRPHLWLLLDAPAEVLQMRKQEVSPYESERQRFAYYALLNKQRSVVVIDASQPLEAVVRQVSEAVIAACEARTHARLQLSRTQHRSPLGARWLLFCCRHRIPLLSKLTRLLFNSDIYCKVPRDLYLPHPYGIVIHSKTQLGRGVTVMQQATLGGKDFGHNVAPTIHDNAYIGAGARVLGDVTVGEGAVVGANAVVTRDVPAHATVVGANRILESGQHRQLHGADANDIADATDAAPNADAEPSFTLPVAASSGAPHR